MNGIDMNEYRDEMISALCDFCRIETVKAGPEPNKPYGNGIFEGLMYLQSLADKQGLDSVNLFGHLVYMDYGQGDETLAILTHIDVVPAGDGWVHEPFGAQVDGGVIYGRGVVDDKGPGIAALYAIKALSDNCVHLNKKVRLIFGGDEETGMGDIEFYLAHEPQPEYLFTPDADFPIVNGEKGCLRIELTSKRPTAGLTELASGVRINVVPAAAHAVFNGSSVDTVGVSAHAAIPENGVNAAGLLLQKLAELTDDAAVHMLAQKLGTEYDGKSAGVACSDAISGPLTLNLGLLTLTDDGRIAASIDIRYPIEAVGEQLAERLRAEFGAEFDIETEDIKPHYVPADAPMIKCLSEAYEEVTGEKARCLAIGGGTYAKHFTNGVAFGPEHEGRAYNIHGAEEQLPVDELIQLSQLIYTAIVKICG